MVQKRTELLQFSVNSCQIDNAPKIISCSKVVGISPFEQFLFSLKEMWVLVTEPCPPSPPSQHLPQNWIGPCLVQ